jgi:outer membrane lipoprotein SlyB
MNQVSAAAARPPYLPYSEGVIGSFLDGIVGGVLGILIGDLLVAFPRTRPASSRWRHLDSSRASLPTLVGLLALNVLVLLLVSANTHGTFTNAWSIAGLAAGYVAGTRISKRLTPWTMQQGRITLVATGTGATVLALGVVLQLAYVLSH